MKDKITWPAGNRLDLCIPLRKITVTEEGTQVRKVTARQNYALETEQFGRCIRQGETPFVSNEFTMMNSRTIDRLLESIGY